MDSTNVPVSSPETSTAPVPVQEGLQTSVSIIEAKLKSPLLTYEFTFGLIEKTTEIQNLFMDFVEQERNIAKALANLMDDFLVQAKKCSDDDKTALEMAKVAFFEYAKDNFFIRETRAREYLTVGRKDHVWAYSLPISHLVEIARLNKKDFSVFSANYSQGKVERMTFKEVQAAVKGSNTNKRNRPKTRTENPVVQETNAADVVQLNEKQNAIENFIKAFDVLTQTANHSDVPRKHKQKMHDIADWCVDVMELLNNQRMGA